MNPPSQLPWKPWHAVVALRDDLRSGELALNQFAADLHEVLMQSGQLAALKGLQTFDESAKNKDAEDLFLKNYPFHPDLTDVFYGKWTSLDRFQKTRGVLRTFALALRQAETWDTRRRLAVGIRRRAAGRAAGEKGLLQADAHYR